MKPQKGGGDALALTLSPAAGSPRSEELNELRSEAREPRPQEVNREKDPTCHPENARLHFDGWWGEVWVGG